MTSTQRQTTSWQISRRISGRPGARRRSALPAAITLAITLALAGCDGLTKSDQLPTGLTDPAVTQTPQGALQAYHGVIVQFRRAFGGAADLKADLAGGFSGGDIEANVVAVGGSLSDELDGSAKDSVINYRAVPLSGTDSWVNSLYSGLQKVRGQASQAIGLLQDYAPEQPVLRGHAYALEGYAEMFLAELFCSGIPLSTLDYHGDYTLHPGSITTQVLAHAVTLFDSALALASSSDTVLNLARLGKARALLGMDSAAQAAAAVTTVADNYIYQAFFVPGSNLDVQAGSSINFFGPAAIYDSRWEFSVADHEGLNGLDYVSGGDPRTAVQNVNGSNQPAKYAPFDGLSPIVVASGVEARLIEAEAALQQGSAAWLDKLNALRTDGTADPAATLYDTLGVTGCDPQHLCGADGVTGGTFQLPHDATLASSTALDLSDKPELQQACVSGSSYAPCSESPAHTTVNVYDVPPQWHAGTGQVAGLAPLADPDPSAAPGPTTSRVDLLFRERAFWLFLTGHRQGDLRRLIRYYGRPPEAVYPIGPGYGNTVMLPIPAQERASNPLFTGCAATSA